jgi:hypothetical protein
LTEANIHTQPASCGCLIINADDWGRDDRTTNRILECFQRRVLSSASGMVFMEDSERTANITQDQGLDIGPTTWEILRTAYQMSNGPFVSGGLLVGCGPRPVLPLAERHWLQRRNYTQLHPEGKVNSCVE